MGATNQLEYWGGGGKSISYDELLSLVESHFDRMREYKNNPRYEGFASYVREHMLENINILEKIRDGRA